MTIDKKTLTVLEAAEVLGLGKTAAYIGVHSGVIPSIKVGRKYRIPVAALQRLLEQGQDRADHPQDYQD